MALRAIDAGFTISPSLKERIQTIEDSEILSQIVFECVTAATSEEFEEKLTGLLSDRIG